MAFLDSKGVRIMLAIYCRTSKKENAEGIATIDQQEKAGIEFAKEKGVSYAVYKDQGKSGYIIKDEDEPFKERPSFMKMLNDIKNGLIDSVWVWENSRLSRISITQSIIYRDFLKYKITLYVKDREYNLNDPATKLQMTLLDAFSEYERQLIVARMSRGASAAKDRQGVHYARLFGYQHDTKTKTDTPIKEDLETVKKMFADYLNEGMTLRAVAEKYKKPAADEPLVNCLSRTRKTLVQFVYTGESLNLDGLDILKRFQKGDLNNLEELKKDQYWLKSPFYKEKVIDRSTWIDSATKIQKFKNTHILPDYKETREKGTSLATGFIYCGICGNKYYFRHYINNKPSVGYIHLNTIKKCSQKPARLNLGLTDTIMDIAFCYYYLMFDNPKQRIKEQKEKFSGTIKETKEILNQLSKDKRKKEKRYEQLESQLDNDKIENILDVVLMPMDRIRKEIANLETKILELQASLEIQNSKLNELTAAEKYEKTTIETLRTWFELRRNDNFEELRLLWSSNFSKMIIENNIVKAIPIKGGGCLYFDITNDYYLIYKYLEKVLDIQIPHEYTIAETKWISKREKEISEYGDKVKAFLLKRAEAKDEAKIITDPETGRELHFGFMKKKTELTDLKSELLFSCFTQNRNGSNLIDRFLLTEPFHELNGKKYYSPSAVSKMVGKAKSNVIDWASRHGVSFDVGPEGRKYYKFTKEEIELYRNWIPQRGKKPGTKNKGLSEKQKQHLEKINKANQSPEARHKRSESLKKAYAEGRRKASSKGLDEYNRKRKEAAEAKKEK